MRRSWPDASEASTFEGRVLTRSSVLVDFRLPVADGAFRAADESLVFVAPSDAEPVEYDVDVNAEGVGLAPIPRAPARAVQPSFPGSHWLTPPPELSQEIVARARMMSRPDDAEADEDDLTLPVLPLARRRSVGDALLDAVADAGEALVGRTASGRVARLGAVVSIVFAGFAVHALVAGTAAPGATATVAVATAGAPANERAASPTAAAPKVEAVVRSSTPVPVVISGGAPVWIVVAPKTPRTPEPPVLEPAPVDKLGLPRPPPPPPRSAFARL
jgi:hypothetical protein